MKVKQGASIDGCRAPILIGLIKIEPLFVSRGIEMVITSGHPGLNIQQNGPDTTVAMGEICEPETCRPQNVLAW